MSATHCSQCGAWLTQRFEYVERAGQRFAEIVYRCQVCKPIRAIDADPKKGERPPHAH